ncbi:MAG: phospholipase D-like domain-containing protein [Thermodesulfobacteriota bacterium]
MSRANATKALRRRWRAVPRPVVGRVLPADLRAPRVADIGRTLEQGLHDPGFAVLLRRIDDAPLLPSYAIEPYFRGAEAFTAMRGAIAAARSEVLLESYIFKDDLIGRDMAHTLAEAARRGVTVRVLADAFGSLATRRAFWGELLERGVEVRLYNPLLPKLWNQGHRDHRKILVVDRAVAFTGGMNVGDEYGAPEGGTVDPWRDTHLSVEGPTAWEMAVVFAEGWQRAGGTPFELPALEPAFGPGAPTLVLDSRPGRGHAESAAVLAAIIGSARRYVWITNSYFAPKAALMDLLGDAAGRGVDVRLLLPGRSDVPIVRHAGHGFFAGLLRRGVRVFEYDASILHAKSLVADDYVSVVGSTNMDYRSFHWNAECNLVLLDHATAARLRAAFHADLERSREIVLPGWRRRRLLHRVGDGLARCLTPLL